VPPQPAVPGAEENSGSAFDSSDEETDEEDDGSAWPFWGGSRGGEDDKRA